MPPPSASGRLIISSADMVPARMGLFHLIRKAPAELRYEPGLARLMALVRPPGRRTHPSEIGAPGTLRLARADRHLIPRLG